LWVIILDLGHPSESKQTKKSHLKLFIREINLLLNWGGSSAVLFRFIHYNSCEKLHTTMPENIQHWRKQTNKNTQSQKKSRTPAVRALSMFISPGTPCV